ncbi:MAG TPA: ABC transporter permease, partial [Blastocatellia bacterium]|nr:ABC transporter permease [Blastocatellia bacterium]
ASPGFFEALNVTPLLGRTFTAEEEKVGKDRVAILSHGFWQRRFGADPAVLGKTLSIESQTYTIIGVMGRDFSFPVEPTDPQLWTPLSFPEGQLQRGAHYLQLIARLKPGVTEEQARANMETIASRLEQQYPDTNTNHTSKVESLHQRIVADVRPALLVLLGAVAFVMLIACANVANLLLARAATRQKEIAIRTALGASRFHLMRQFLTESLLLALVGGGLGLLLAMWGVDLLVYISPEDIPRLNEVGLDGRVLLFTLSVSVLTGLLFGMAPAIQASKPDLTESLKDAGRGSIGSFRGNRTRSFLVVAEVALGVVLLIASGLLIRSFVRLQQVAPGFDPLNLVVMSLSLPGATYEEDEKQVTFYKQFVERVKSQPGIESAALIAPLPMGGNTMMLTFRVEGREPLPPGQRQGANWRTTTDGYFKAMSIPLVRGRAFSESDDEKSPKVIIINEAMAQQHFAGEEPLGQRITIGYGANNTTAEIIGIVGNVKHQGLNTQSGSEMYTSILQTPLPFANLVIKTSLEPQSIAAAVQNQAAALDQDLPIHSAKPMASYLAASISRPRFNTLLLTIFAAIALVLAGVGIYGVMAYSVAQRTHEMGIRMALGARRADVLKLVVGQGMTLATVGVGLGLAAAYGLTRLMESLLFGVTATDPVTFAGVSLVLATVSLLANLIPARRATKVDPMVALRYE